MSNLRTTQDKNQAQLVSSVTHQRSWLQHWRCWVVFPAPYGDRHVLPFLLSSSLHLSASLLYSLQFSSQVLLCVSHTSRPNPLPVPVLCVSGSWSQSAASHSTSVTWTKSHTNMLNLYATLQKLKILQFSSSSRILFDLLDSAGSWKKPNMCWNNTTGLLNEITGKEVRKYPERFQSNINILEMWLQQL